MDRSHVRAILVMLVSEGVVTRNQAVRMENLAVTNLVEKNYDNLTIEDVLDQLGIDDPVYNGDKPADKEDGKARNHPTE